VGTKDKRDFEVKDLETQKEILNFTDIYAKYLDMKEPRSNRGLEIFKTQEEMDAEKKAAKEKAEAKVQEKKASAAANAEKKAEGKEQKKEGKKKEANSPKEDQPK
jgi:hypothetical protein